MKNSILSIVVIIALSLLAMSLSAQSTTSTVETKNVAFLPKQLPFNPYGGRFVASQKSPNKNEAYRHFNVGIEAFSVLREGSKPGAAVTVGFETYPKKYTPISFETSLRGSFNKEETTKGYSFNSPSFHAKFGMDFLKELPGSRPCYKKSPLFFSLGYIAGFRHYTDMSEFDTPVLDNNGQPVLDANGKAQTLGVWRADWCFEQGIYAAVHFRLANLSSNGGSHYLWLDIAGEYTTCNMKTFTDKAMPNGWDGKSNNAFDRNNNGARLSVSLHVTF